MDNGMCFISFNGIIINGEATNFFKIGRGLRQGCTFSPLLFILIMVSFSRGLQSMKEICVIKGCILSRKN